MISLLGGPGINLITPPTNNELFISSSSATNLAEAFALVIQQPLMEKWAILIATCASALAAIFSFLVALNQLRLSKKKFTNSVHLLFFDIQNSLPMEENGKLTANHKQLVCNYFDFVCWLIERRRIDAKEATPLFEAMRLDIFKDFVERQREKNSELYDCYWRWLYKQSI